MTPGQQAEALVAEYAISDPRDLDVEAIAFDVNVDVVYGPLKGCEASLVGFDNRAIATIRRSGSRGRERFSIAHELGHWMMHRGRTFRCRADDPDQNLQSDLPLERQADEFASHLLLPGPLFNPLVKEAARVGFRELHAIAEKFETSMLATAFRLVRVDTLPVILACYGPAGRRWHLASPHVPTRWWLKSALDEDSFAFDLLKTGTPCLSYRKQSAETWFDNDDADDFEVLEQCIHTTNRDALVLLYLSDVEMFDRGFDPGVGNRRYNEFGSYLPSRRQR
ncbi:MAG: hypothetical protein RJA99_2420 [Pseudomonadota bacterium]|jgi:hypothetical protein